MKNIFKNFRFTALILLISIALMFIGSIWLSREISSEYFTIIDDEYEFFDKFFKNANEINNYTLKYSNKIFEKASDATKEQLANYDDSLIFAEALFNDYDDVSKRYFILKKDSNEIIYNKDDSYIGKELDIKNGTISKNNFEFLKLFGELGIAKNYTLGDYDLVIFVKLISIMRRPVIYMIFTVLAFLLCSIFLTIYSVVVSEEANLIREGFSDTADITKYEKVRRRKINIITLTSTVVMVLLMSFFTGVYAISAASEGSNNYYTRVKNLANCSKYSINVLNKFTNEYCKMSNDYIVDILQNNPSKINRDELDNIKNGLPEVKEIRILDLNGETICTSNGIDKFRLSTNKEDSSYQCWKLLSEDGFIVLPENSDVNGDIFQYACSTLRNNEQNVIGIVMTKYDENEKHQIEKMFDWYETFNALTTEEDILYYVYDKTNDEILHATSYDLMGQKTDSENFPKKISYGEFQGFYTLKGEDFFGRTIEIDEKVVGTFLSLDNINDIIVFDISILILFAITIFIAYAFYVKKISKDCTVKKELLETQNKKSFIVNKMHITDWSRTTGTQKISYLMSYLFSIIMLIFSIILLFGDKIFGEASIINYIINGNWHHSFNVLALSKCIMITSFIFLVAFIINKLLEILSHSFDSRGVTICKLLINFVRYASIFTAIYQCLILVGVDARTLVASAGILSLVVGFGANKLIQEIVSGLFIIFEGSFQVGDTITIGNGNFTGVVKEIGIRNSKIESVDGNMMIISNSHLDNVVNHSTAKTLIVYEYKVDKKITLDKCDKFFESKIDYLKERFGNIIINIRYDGIVSYDDDTYTIRFSFSCVEENKVKIEYKVDSEMKLLLDELQNIEDKLHDQQ